MASLTNEIKQRLLQRHGRRFTEGQNKINGDVSILEKDVTIEIHRPETGEESQIVRIPRDQFRDFAKWFYDISLSHNLKDTAAISADPVNPDDEPF